MKISDTAQLMELQRIRKAQEAQVAVMQEIHKLLVEQRRPLKPWQPGPETRCDACGHAFGQHMDSSPWSCLSSGCRCHMGQVRG